MDRSFGFSEFLKRFPDDESCFEEIKLLRFRDGFYCEQCKKITEHYRVKDRTAFSCEFCRHQVYPMAGTIFEKTTTPLRIWFYAMFLMTHTRSGISITQLQKELGVTYKTAWRMFTSIHLLMEQNNGDLLSGVVEIDEVYKGEQGKSRIYRWTLFNKFEIRVVQKEEPEK